MSSRYTWNLGVAPIVDNHREVMKVESFWENDDVSWEIISKFLVRILGQISDVYQQTNKTWYYVIN